MSVGVTMARRRFLAMLAGFLGAAGGSVGCASTRSSFKGPLFPAFSSDRLEKLLATLTIREKLQMLSGPPLSVGRLYRLAVHYNAEPIVAGALPNRGIPGVRFTDGPRGVVMDHATCFPVAMARGASWDPTLEERVADAMGVEARSLGANLFAGICVNLLRHPGWGRAQETYGEDPVLLAAMGSAAVRGVQRHVMACVKHFACNSIENSRFCVNVRVGSRALREIYLPHFKACIDAGVAAVMSAYNRVNGDYCGENRVLLTEILKQEWGFEGFVMSDFFWGTHEGPAALAAGLDLEMPFRRHFADLRAALANAIISASRVDDAARRLLRQQVRFATEGEPERYGSKAVASPAHALLARTAAIESLVLLKNAAPFPKSDPTLPLLPSRVRSLAVIGTLAQQPNLGDHGSSRVRPPYVVTPWQGLREAYPDAKLHYDPGHSAARAARLAATCDAAVVVVGLTFKDEGEYIYVMGGDRASLRLHPEDELLVCAVAAANARTIAVLMAGSALVTEAWRHHVPAILMAWYPGMEGGRAIAQVIAGNASPGGKLPCVFPRSEAHLPPFDPEASEVEYDLFPGYRHLDRIGAEPAFPFGFGLSYTSFALTPPQLDEAIFTPSGSLVVKLGVRNTGTRLGSEVVQLYVSYPDSKVVRPVKELKAFQKVGLEPGEACDLKLRVSISSLAYWDERMNEFVVEPGRYVAWVGTSSAWQDLVALEFRITSR